MKNRNKRTKKETTSKTTLPLCNGCWVAWGFFVWVLVLLGFVWGFVCLVLFCVWVCVRVLCFVWFFPQKKKKKLNEKSLTSITGYLLSEEKNRKSSWPRSAVTFLSSFPSNTLRTSERNGTDKGGEQGQLNTSKSQTDNFPTTGGECKIYWRQTYCSSYFLEASGRLGLLLPVNRLKNLIDIPRESFRTVKILCGQIIVLATILDDNDLFQTLLKRCDLEEDVLLMQNLAALWSQCWVCAGKISSAYSSLESK